MRFFFFLTDAVFTGWRPSLFEWNHLGFEYFGTFHHQPCVKWPWIWNESTLQIFSLGWCHKQIWVLFSWLIIISSKPLMYLCPSSRIIWEALHIYFFIPLWMGLRQSLCLQLLFYLYRDDDLALESLSGVLFR